MTFNGSIRIDFAHPQKYVGLLWGTPDHGQALQLYSETLRLVGSFSGDHLLDWGLVSITDDNRSAYVNIDSQVPFDFVVATPSVFEFDNLAYFTDHVALPGESRTLAFPNGSAVPDGGFERGVTRIRYGVHGRLEDDARKKSLTELQASPWSARLLSPSSNIRATPGVD